LFIVDVIEKNLREADCHISVFAVTIRVSSQYWRYESTKMLYRC